MSELVDRITAVLNDELDEHGCEDDDEKRQQVAHHWAERIVAELGMTAVRCADERWWSTRIERGVY